MSESTGKFGCDGCGKQYKWKPQLAGKKVKCKCGSVMVVPETVEQEQEMAEFELAEESTPTPAPPPPPPPKPEPTETESDPSPDDVASKLGAGSTATLDPSSSSVDAYGMSGDTEAGMDSPAPAAGDKTCPECGAPMAADAVLCVACGFNTATGQKLGGASVAMDSGDSGENTGKLGGMLGKMKGSSPSDEAISMGDAGDDKLWKAKQVIIPAALVVIGLFLRGLLAKLLADDPDYFGPGLTAELIGTIVGAVIGTALLIGAAFLTARFMAMTFGSLPTAILKFAAVTIAPTAFAGILAYMAGPDWSFFVAFPVEIGLYFGLIFWLFDLDLMEGFVLVIINWVIQNFIAAFLMAMVLSAFV